MSRQNPLCIISEGEPVTDEKSISKIISDYFASIGAKLAAKIEHKLGTKAPPPLVDLPYSFDFQEVDEPSVLRELAALKTNKATGLNQINAKLLKDSTSTIVSGLTKIINASLFSQTFPAICKKGKIVPLYKSNDSTSPNNYRPISILPILSQIMEHIVYQQVYEYLQQCNLITSEQFGFRPKVSTSIVLTQLHVDRGNTSEYGQQNDHWCCFYRLKKGALYSRSQLINFKIRKFLLLKFCLRLVSVISITIPFCS